MADIDISMSAAARTEDPVRAIFHEDAYNGAQFQGLDLGLFRVGTVGPSVDVGLLGGFLDMQGGGRTGFTVGVPDAHLGVGATVDETGVGIGGGARLGNTDAHLGASVGSVTGFAGRWESR